MKRIIYLFSCIYFKRKLDKKSYGAPNPSQYRLNFRLRRALSIFPNIHTLLISLSVCLISSVSVERFFSKVNHVMVPSRRSMTSERLNNLCFLSFERDITLYLEKKLQLVKSEYNKLRV